MRIASAFTACLLVAFATFALPQSSQADDNTAYVVASDATFDSLTGMKAYFKDAGVNFIQVKDKSGLAEAKRFLIFGSPAEQGLAGDFIRSALDEKEITTANTMGKGVLVEKEIEGKPALIFATAYSMQTFVKSHTADWKDYFESWYLIAQSITSIIGY